MNIGWLHHRAAITFFGTILVVRLLNISEGRFSETMDNEHHLVSLEFQTAHYSTLSKELLPELGKCAKECAYNTIVHPPPFTTSDQIFE